jgi:hypothetical protein
MSKRFSCPILIRCLGMFLTFSCLLNSRALAVTCIDAENVDPNSVSLYEGGLTRIPPEGPLEPKNYLINSNFTGSKV